MQRTVSRSPFLAVNAADDSRTGGEDTPPFAWSALLAILALLLAARGAWAGDSDNVLLDFTATWCGPCQQMSSIVSRLERQGFPIRKVDVDREPKLAAKYGVESIPCFVLVAGGRELERANGITSEQQLRSMMARLPKPAPAARNIPEARPRDQAGPSLGKAVPLTPPPAAGVPRQALPLEPATPDPVAEFAGNFDNPVLSRGQSPEIDPLSASVRIRVKDGTAINFGSGTIIDSQPGRATILSCAHIFRKLSKNAVIEIDVFPASGAKPDTIPGRVLLTDAEADVGLVTASYPVRLPVVPLGLSRPLAVNERLFSIGCSGGDSPTRENLELTAINKYRGPENLEGTGRPQKGRSGGGLFRADELIGVCIAADPEKPLGLYTGLQPIGLLLEKAGLTHVAPRIPQTAPASPAVAAADPPESPASDAVESPFHSTTDSQLQGLLQQAASGDPAGTLPQEFAGAEIICIVRSRIPGQPSRVVIVNQASERFVADLLHEATPEPARPQGDSRTVQRRETNPSNGPVETSLELQRYRRAGTR